MNEFIEKLIGRLEEKENEAVLKAPNTNDISNIEYQKWMMKSYGFKESIEIVIQEAEKYNNGWIPAEEELPETDKYILLSFSNFSIPCVGRYEEDENGGAFYVGDDDKSCVSHDMFVNAWMNLPVPYQPKGE